MTTIREHYGELVEGLTEHDIFPLTVNFTDDDDHPVALLFETPKDLSHFLDADIDWLHELIKNHVGDDLIRVRMDSNKLN